jgi:hypothetical protein
MTLLAVGKCDCYVHMQFNNTVSTATARFRVFKEVKRNVYWIFCCSLHGVHEEKIHDVGFISLLTIPGYYGRKKRFKRFIETKTLST